MSLAILVLDIGLPLLNWVLAEVIAAVVVLCMVGVRTYLRRPNGNNQFQQTQEDVREFFLRVNQKN
jgi:hypothetical protein